MGHAGVRRRDVQERRHLRHEGRRSSRTARPRRSPARPAAGYDMEISMPATMGGERRHEDDGDADRPDVDRQGRAGHGRVHRRSTRARSRRAGSSATRARAKGSPGQAKAMAEMYKQLAATGGVPYETEMNIKMGGDGPMAGDDGQDGRHDDDQHRAVGRNRRAGRRPVRAAGRLQESNTNKE